MAKPKLPKSVAKTPSKSKLRTSVQFEDVVMNSDSETEAPVATVNQNQNTEFDWDEFNSNPDLELWAIRLPPGVKAKHLEGIELDFPSKITAKTAKTPIGHFTSKKTDYSVSIGAIPRGSGLSKPEGKKRTQVATPDIKGGEEMRDLVPLLPKNSAHGRLFKAPRPLTGSLVITRTLPNTILDHMPSDISSLLHSQPSPIPGSVLATKDLLNRNTPQVQSKLATLKRDATQPAAVQSDDCFSTVSVLPGMGSVGGAGRFNNTPVQRLPEFNFDKPVLTNMEQENQVDQMDEDEQLEQAEVVEADQKPKKIKKEKKTKKGEDGERKKKKKDA